MHEVISKAFDVTLATGATSDLLKRGVAIAQKLRVERNTLSAVGVVVDPNTS